LALSRTRRPIRATAHALTFAAAPAKHMDDLDFTRPARSEIYDPAVARACFESLGKPEAFAEGAAIFDENEAADRMYCLLEGDVRLVRGSRTIDIVKAGEIFGEMAVITGQPRSAGAIARGACRGASLDAKQFERAIQGTPEFALMLSSIIINRVRLTTALLARTGKLPGPATEQAGRIFDQALLDELADELKQRPPQRYPPSMVIVREGESALYMYLVMQGRVAVSLKSAVVERIGPGGIFGEMALVDQSARAASAEAETECVLQPISRSDFLALIRAKPAFALSLLRALAGRLRRMTSQQR
ncbi:MAG: cyclic nucleotide-binding domain-containing protein, partial [Burkholderiales bacterium]